MGTFAETASFDYRLPLSTKENKLIFSISVCSKQMEVFRCCFSFTENKRKLPFFISSVFRLRNSRNVETWRHGDEGMETWRHRDMETLRHGDIDTWRHRDMDMETTDGKRKPRRFSLIGLLFAHRANGGLSFVCLLTKKQTEVIHVQINLIGLAQLCIYSYV
jgi:hypothetical protein